MHPQLTGLFHALPGSLRVVAASLRGWQLRRLRYDRHTDALIREAEAREFWTAGEWQAWLAPRLADVLRHAALQVPAYRDLWRRGDAGSRPWEDLSRWPILTKARIRERPDDFIAADANRRRLNRVTTSGTSGAPLTVWQSPRAVREWYALGEARWLRWYGLTRHDRWAMIGGQIVVPFARTEPPYWVWNAVGRQLYLSAYHISRRTAPAYVEAMTRARVRYLWAYSSAAYALAQFMLERRVAPPRLEAVITNAEPLFAHQREAIVKAFQCPAYETYGMNEMVAAASECRHGRLHLWPAVGATEILQPDADVPAPPGTPGRLVATGLVNDAMPLVRYEVGDLLTLEPAESTCPCGRTMPILRRLEGRSDDVVVTPDGRRIGRLGPVFHGDMPIAESQIVQETLTTLRVLVAPLPAFGREHERLLEERLRERVGPMEIVVERRESLSRGANGKLKTVVSRLGNDGVANTRPS